MADSHPPGDLGRAHAVVLLLLLSLPCLLFPGAIPGPKVVTAHDHLSVHHVMRDSSEDGGRVSNPQLSDPAVQFLPLRRRVTRAWWHGEPPLWNPDIYGGAPLLADAQSAACYPLVMLEPLAERGFPQGEDRALAAAQDLRVWLHLVLPGVGAALLAWCLGASAAGGLVAGAVAMLSAFPVCRALHPHAWVYAWVPWLALGVLRVARGRGGVLGIALPWAMMSVAGHPQTALHGLLFAGLLGAATLRDRRAWLRMLAGLVLGFLLAAPALLPFFEQLARSATVHARTGGRLPPEALLTLAWPDPFGHPARGGWTGEGAHLESNLHVGLLALGLAFYGLRRRAGRYWMGGAALALAVALGLPLLWFVPVNHARLGGMAGLAIAIAAGLALPRRRWAWLLTALVVGELLWARRSDQSTLDRGWHHPASAPWVDELRTRQGEGRISGLGWAIQPNTGMGSGLRDLRGYDLPVSLRTERLMAALDPALVRPWFPIGALGPENEALLRFGAVRYLAVVEGDARAEHSVEGLEELPLRDAPLRAFALEPEAPRAWLAFAAQRSDGVESALRAVRDAEQARRRPPVVVRGQPDPALAQLFAASGRQEIRPVALEEPSAERVVLTFESPRPGMVVLADAWAPGWRAELDGEPAPIREVAGAFRGVVVGPGSHEVEFRYRPGGWVWGLRLGWVGLLGALGLLVRRALRWARRRER